MRCSVSKASTCAPSWHGEAGRRARRRRTCLGPHRPARHRDGYGDRGPDPRRGRHRSRPAAGPRAGTFRKAYADWLRDCGAGFTAGIRTAALDPFRGYTNAIRDELPEAITVLDAFHVVKLGSAMVDEVRRRVQRDTLGHRGRKKRSALRDPPEPADRR
ncbi:transposase [Arthrobacter sp. 2MCAF15]|uniref:transposase n=1 Tax=Arthrobacter sp. 2MCAF15 TaxID=3232984 RepID=UPI003F91DE77